MNVSVIIVVFNAEKFIIDCIKSVQTQFEDNYSWELIIVDSNCTDNTIQNAYQYLNLFNFQYKIIKNIKGTLAAGWNLGIINSTKEYIIRCDAHSRLEQGYIKHAIQILLSDNNLVAVGGILKNESDTYIGKLFSITLSNPVGVGNAKFRIGVKLNTYTNTVVYGVYRRSIYKNVGLLNENYNRNQDIEFHSRVTKAGFKMMTSPEIKAIYYNRNNISSLVKQSYKNGLWITKGSSRHLHHLVPLLFTLTLFVTLLACIELTIIITIVYFTVVPFSYFAISKVFNPVKLLILSLLTFMLHISYGSGSIMGLVSKINFGNCNTI